MATYVIGDVHGCFDELQVLLSTFSFNPKTDSLWFTGDLVNGGNKSVETLEFIQNLSRNNQAICVLGNHDLTLLGIAAGKISPIKDRQIGFEALLNASNKVDLLSWLQKQPIIHYDSTFDVLVVHAGIAPQWNIDKALALGNEVTTVLRGEQATEFFGHMFGNTPATWNDDLSGWARIRCILNYMTRMRFCTTNGKLDLVAKGPANTAPPGMMPWYQAPNRLSKSTKIIFGHWAALIGKTNCKNAIALDTGCIWGNYLSAIRLDDYQIFSVNQIKD